MSPGVVEYTEYTSYETYRSAMATQLAPTAAHTTAVPVQREEAANTLLDDGARTCVAQFGEWVAAHAGEFGLGVASLRVRRWQSVESLEWIQLIVDVYVTGTAGDALRFWERASGVLEELVPAHHSPAAELLAEQVHWR